ncbi:hypothetical protein Tco_1475252 [Tanacetum coccineum]
MMPMARPHMSIQSHLSSGIKLSLFDFQHQEGTNRPVDTFWGRQTSVKCSGTLNSVSIKNIVLQSFNSYIRNNAGNEAVMSISVDDCIDLDGIERSILAKVKDLSVISELLKHMSSEGFDDVGLRYVGGRWVWLEFDSMDQVERVKTSKVLKEIFLEFKDVSHDAKLIYMQHM